MPKRNTKIHLSKISYLKSFTFCGEPLDFLKAWLIYFPNFKFNNPAWPLRAIQS